MAPGLGNGIGMAFCALRANTPLIITAGQQDTRLRLSDPVLGHDLVAMARPVTKWSVQVERADEFALIMRRAYKIANEGPSGPVFVALPIDVMEQETQIGAAAAGPLHRGQVAAAEAVKAAAQVLLSAKAPVIVCGDDVGRSRAADALVKLAETIGAAVWYEGIRGQASFPTSHATTGDTLAATNTVTVKDFIFIIFNFRLRRRRDCGALKLIGKTSARANTAQATETVEVRSSRAGRRHGRGKISLTKNCLEFRRQNKPQWRGEGEARRLVHIFELLERRGKPGFLFRLLSGGDFFAERAGMLAVEGGFHCLGESAA